MDKSKLLILGILIVIYIVSAGASYKVLSSINVPGLSAPITAPTPGIDGRLTFDPKLPKTQECPLNGAKYSRQQEQWWQKHRPLGVMIENHQEARPQSGLSLADVVYEAVAEGGITRFIAVFYCQDPGQVGPVRSARTYFIDFLSEYGNSPLYAHVGGANASGPADALSQLTDYGWTGHNDMNQFSIGFPVFWRDYERLGHTVATEHTMYSTGVKLWNYGAKIRKLTNVDDEGTQWDEDFTAWKFKNDSPSKGTQKIHVEFWPSMGSSFFVDWAYDPVTNSYKRNLGGVPHIDKDSNKQVVAKNVAVLTMVENNANDGYENNVHLLYKTKGKGKASVFMDGKQITGIWEKDSRTDRTIISDSKGEEIKFNRGQIWVEILPSQQGVLKVQ